MAAPALVALAHGSRDPRSAATITALVDEVRAMRPDLRIEQAFLELSKPSFTTVVDRLVRPATTRSSSYPLLLTEAYHAKVDVPGAIAAAAARHEGLQIRATLDPRPRAAASSRCSTCGCARRSRPRRVRELDALVLAAAGSSDPLANQAVARLARVWGQPPQAAGDRGVRLRRPAGHRRGGARSSGPRAAATSRSPRCSWRPGFLPDRAAELALEAGADRGLRAAGRPPASWPAPSWPGTPSAPSSSSPSEPSRRRCAGRPAESAQIGVTDVTRALDSSASVGVSRICADSA